MQDLQIKGDIAGAGRRLPALEDSPHARKAMALFREGYNCAQSVFLAFEEEHHWDRKAAARISCAFGGGMGRLREVCGAMSGVFLALGCLYGYDDPQDYEGKKRLYGEIQKLAGEYGRENGRNSIICRELLGLPPGGDDPVPQKRSEEYYAKRPCIQLIGTAAAILERYIGEHPL